MEPEQEESSYLYQGVSSFLSYLTGSTEDQQKPPENNEKDQSSIYDSIMNILYGNEQSNSTVSVPNINLPMKRQRDESDTQPQRKTSNLQSTDDQSQEQSTTKAISFFNNKSKEEIVKILSAGRYSKKAICYLLDIHCPELIDAYLGWPQLKGNPKAARMKKITQATESWNRTRSLHTVRKELKNPTPKLCKLLLKQDFIDETSRFSPSQVNMLQRAIDKFYNGNVENYCNANLYQFNIVRKALDSDPSMICPEYLPASTDEEIFKMKAAIIESECGETSKDSEVLQAVITMRNISQFLKQDFEMSLLFYPILALATIQDIKSSLQITVWQSTDPCGWSGIYCNSQGQVISISLSSIEFQGQLTTGLFSGLTELKFVSISAYNKKTTASGVIPQDICISGKLEQLELSHLTLAGSIPLKLMQCSSLKIIRIYNCGISGPLPSDFSKLSNLEILELSFNQLGGSISSSLAQLPKLEYLKLSNNKIEGQLPFIQSPFIKVIDVRDNNLEGDIPDGLLDIQTLEYIGLEFNELTIPSICKELSYCQPIRNV